MKFEMIGKLGRGLRNPHTPKPSELPEPLYLDKGFTLVEMLVVMGIIAVLIAASLGGYSAMTKSAEKQKCQELVSNTATALTALFNDKGYWPEALLKGNAGQDAQLDEKAAYPLAVGNYMSLAYDKAKKATIGLDACGVVDPWALVVVKRAGSGASASTPVPGGKTVGDHVLHYALDLDGNGIVEGASVGGTPIDVRATAIVWSCGKDGVVSSYPYAGGGGGGKGSNNGASKGKADDVYSWTPGQTRNVK